MAQPLLTTYSPQPSGNPDTAHHQAVPHQYPLPSLVSARPRWPVPALLEDLQLALGESPGLAAVACDARAPGVGSRCEVP